MRINSFDSPKSIIPSIAVPTAPIPVHTAYAVPTGNHFKEYANSPMLIKMQTTVKTLGQNFVNPSEYFIPIAQAVSKIPAIKSINQAIINLECIMNNVELVLLKI